MVRKYKRETRKFKHVKFQDFEIQQSVTFDGLDRAQKLQLRALAQWVEDTSSMKFVSKTKGKYYSVTRVK